MTINNYTTIPMNENTDIKTERYNTFEVDNFFQYADKSLPTILTLHKTKKWHPKQL